MGKTAIIYKSKYGSTRKYAEWIAQELEADLFEVRKVKTASLTGYDVIIYGGAIYAGGVSGISWFKGAFPSISSKALYLFTVGVGDVNDNQNIQHIRNGISKTLAPEAEAKLKVFHFRGGLDYSRLSFVHRMIMGMMRRVLAKKPETELTSNEKIILATHGKTVDYTDRSAIATLVQDARAV